MIHWSLIIDFIGVDRFDLIVSSYLINLYNYIKTKEIEIQVDLFILLMSCKYGNKIKGLKHSKYLFIWSGIFQISKMNSSMSLFQVKGSDVGQNLQFNFDIFYVKNVILGLSDLFPYFYVLLIFFKSNLVPITVRY